MSRPILDKGYQFAVRTRGAAEFAVQKVADEIHDIYIAPFVIAADVVDPAGNAPLQHGLHRPRMVLHMEPVTHVQPIAIYRQRLLRNDIVDHEGYQLLREVVRPVVVGAAGDCDGQSERAVVRQHQKVRGRLGGRVGRGGVDG